MITTLIQSIRMLLVFTLLTGFGYTLGFTEVAGRLFPAQASGSLVKSSDRIVGSQLLAQSFSGPNYFWPRPSAGNYSAIPSGASNQGPTSAALKAMVAERREAFGASAPVDLLTASGSGLDPHLSPDAVRFQIPRVAAARGIPAAELEKVVASRIEGPQFGVLGEPRVNVLELNRFLEGR